MTPPNPGFQVLPNLAGVATKDLVENIGSGSFKASYINWSRTLQLLRQHAPGWLVDTVPADDGGLLHRAPVGAYLLIRFVHVDGTATPAVPQAIMDHRNAAIPFEKITARDITDTQRRGACLAAAMTFGLAAELWAKMPLESGWGSSDAEEAPKAAPAAPKAAPAAKKAPQEAATSAPEPTEADFREAALAKGVDTRAIDVIVKKLNGKWAAGIANLAKKSAEELNAQYAPADDGEQW